MKIISENVAQIYPQIKLEYNGPARRAVEYYKDVIP